MLCYTTLTEERDNPPNKHRELARTRFEACTQVKECGALGTCLERTGCQFVLTGPDDKTPQPFCGIPPD